MAISFDFDEWVELAKTAPETFEQRRLSATEQVITSGSNVRRLRGLQFQIDAERVRAHTPYKACLQLSDLMWGRLFELREKLNDLTVDPAPGAATEVTPADAEIVPFPSRRQDH